MTNTYEDYMNTLGTIASSTIEGDDGLIYISRVDGSYVGRVNMEDNLYTHLMLRGVNQVESRDGGKTACIGWSEKEQKWYGWSHRACYGFTIGSKTERGDCGYQPIDKEDFLAECLRFWDEEHHAATTVEHTSRLPDVGILEHGVGVSWVYSNTVPNEKLRGTTGGVFTAYPDTWGRGEWTATTLDEAKQMASDFAVGVS